MNRDYILEDSNYYQYNSEFKPDYAKNGDKYHGYRTNNQEAIFYYFAVQGYDLTFSYNGGKTARHLTCCPLSWSRSFGLH